MAKTNPNCLSNILEILGIYNLSKGFTKNKIRKQLKNEKKMLPPVRFGLMTSCLLDGSSNQLCYPEICKDRVAFNKQVCLTNTM